MKLLQLTTATDSALKDLTDIMVNPIFIYCYFALLLLACFSIVARASNCRLINAEIVFKENSKAELSGDFEVSPQGYYTHLETRAMFYERDILYIKNEKSVKKMKNE